MAVSMLEDTPLDAATHHSCSVFGDYLQYVSSIHPDLMEQCPSSFGRAMLDPFHRAQWRESLFGYLSSCYSMGTTYGCPTIPPSGATILPAVIVLKQVLNQ
jgi:hypothetical protein